jgi:hypothetical protein
MYLIPSNHVYGGGMEIGLRKRISKSLRNISALSSK